MDIEIRQPNKYDVKKVSDETGIDCSGDEVRTQQHFAEECDINTIVRRFGLTGQLPTDVRMPVSGDFTGITDLHSAMIAVREATEAFEALPAEVRRDRFNNDPGAFVRFCSDDANAEEAKKLGLVRPQEPAPAPIEVKVVSQPAAAPVAP